MRKKEVLDKVNSPVKKGNGMGKAILSGTVLFAVFSLILAGLSLGTIPNGNAATEMIEQPFVCLESAGGTYWGAVQGVAYSGNGEFQHLGGGKYIGTFGESKRSGNGAFTWPNGDSYEGTWAEDQMVTGTYTFADGRTYNGTFANNQFVSGTFSVPSTAADYNYQKCVVTIIDGTVSELDIEETHGLIYKGAVTGHADITYPSGNCYSGEVADCAKDGTGTFVWQSSTESQALASYTGQWSNDLMNGVGTYFYTKSDYPKLCGEFLKGTPEGTLSYYKAADDKFDTVWENGICTAITES